MKMSDFSPDEQVEIVQSIAERLAQEHGAAPGDCVSEAETIFMSSFETFAPVHPKQMTCGTGTRDPAR